MRTAGLLVLSFACFTACRKQPPIATLPPPPVQAVPPVHHDEKLPEPPAPQASQSETGHPSLPDQPVAVIPPPPAPVDKPKKRPKRKAVPPPVQQAKAEEPAGPPAPDNTEPAPKLGQLLTPGQEQSYNQAIDRDLQRAKRNLAIAEGKALSDSQKSVVQQVQSFLKQAEDLRKTDLVEAKGLSHKADILALDLAQSLQ